MLGTRRLYWLTVPFTRGNKSTSSKSSSKSRLTDQELLTRVTVVEDTVQSGSLVENMLDQATPVAVDMEGVVDNRNKKAGQLTGLVQVCDQEGNISLFRTGRNPSLYRAGRLAELLESPGIIKILHGSSEDCRSAHLDGVRLANIFDTALAYRVLRFQNEGVSIHNQDQIGLSKLCENFSLPIPKNSIIKKTFLRKMIIPNYKGLRGIDTAAVMDEETQLYCAWDVEPLHSLYTRLIFSLHPDWGLQLAQLLSQREILKMQDPDKAKTVNTQLRQMELNGELKDIRLGASRKNNFR